MTALSDKAEVFARDLADTLSSFLGRNVRFSATQAGTRFVIAPLPTDDLALAVAPSAHLSLNITYRCELDSRHAYLKVVHSSVGVHPGPRPKGDPLFPYENDASRDRQPVSHLHVHAHRDHFARLMTVAAIESGAKRLPAPDKELEVARLSTLHFPLGGHRFRPSLEDVLEMISAEFGVQPAVGWDEKLRFKRIEWRRQQTGSAVRDCPSEAVRVLRELGFTVDEPSAGMPEDRLERLAAY